MSKVNIKYTIKSNNNKTVNKEVKGILKDNKLSFKDNDCNMMVTFEEYCVIITRDSDKYNLELKFKINESLQGKYVLKKEKLIVDVKTNVTKLSNEEQKLELEYGLYFNDELTDTFIFKLEWSE